MFADPGFLLVVVLLVGAALIYNMRRGSKGRAIERRDPDVSTAEVSDEQWNTILFDHAPAAYLEIDKQGNIHRANKSACGLFGLSEPVLSGKHLADLVPEVERERYRTEISRKLSGGAECIPYERKYLRSDGSMLTLEVRETLLSTGGRLIGMLWGALDATERHEKQEEVMQTTSELKALFGALPDLFIRCDTTGKILDFESGPSAEGFALPGSHIGKRLSAVLPADGGQKIERALASVKETRSMAVVEYSASGEKDQEYFEARVVPLHWDQVIVIVRNISERKRAEERLEQFAQEVQWKNEELATALVSARDATDSKNRFLSNMGHEIHTPMSGVMGMLDMLLDTRLDSDQREYAESVRTCAGSLLQLLNNVLDLSRIGSGTLKPDHSPLDVASTLRQVAEMYASQAHAKGLEFSSFIAPELSGTLRGDVSRLRQVLANLLANAVKFTERGSVTLRAELASETAERIVLRCTIEDTGPGLDASQQEKIMATLAAAAITPAHSSGAGFGLTISRQLVELLGGQIGFSSTAGRGSSFWFTAVLEKRDVKPGVAGAPLNGVRVLLVAAPGAGSTLLRQSLESWGCQCHNVPGAPLTALKEAARKGQPMRVAIVDADLPGISLTEIAKSVSSDPLTHETALVVLASSLRDDPTNLRMTGFQGFLGKPVLPSQLHDVLMDVLRLHVAPAPEPKPAVRTGGTRVLVAEDNEVNQRITLRYLSTIGLHADVVASGREALSAFEKNTYDLILMDCLMPEMDGFEATAEIRRREGATRHTPICALTALTMDGSRERCIAAGMDDYISKPFSAAELHNAVHRLIGYTVTR